MASPELNTRIVRRC